MKVIFLDRDGTLNDDPGYLNDPNQLRLKEGVIEGLSLLQVAGFEFIIITNQSGVSRDLITKEQLEEVHQKLCHLLGKHNLPIRKIYYCPDQDDSSPCRKPNPKMICDAINEFPIDLERSYIIGDRFRDILAGSDLNIPGILLGDTSYKEEGEFPRNLIKKGDNFLEAAQFVLQAEYEKIWRDEIYHQKEDRFSKKIEGLKKNKNTLVFTNGCFDLWHSGHLQYLAQAASLGDHLIIGLNSDASVKKLKGVNRPILPAHERALKLIHLSFVSLVVIFEENTPIEIIKTIEPDIHVKGGDYKKKDLPEFSILNQIGAQLVILPFKEGFSTSAIIDKIQNIST